MKVAKSSNRAFATLFDFLILSAMCLIVLIPSIVSLINVISNDSALNSAAMYISAFISGALCVVLIILYLIVLPVYWKGQTLGKRFFHLQITKTNGLEIDFRTMFIREIIRIFFIFATLGLCAVVDFLTLLCAKNHATYYDIIASTTVVDAID